VRQVLREARAERGMVRAGEEERIDDVVHVREVDQRLAGGLALAALALAKGAKILRVHDVLETVDVVRMLAAVEAAE
jgi:dihydropteroate synthase